jgi:hypothetical protein
MRAADAHDVAAGSAQPHEQRVGRRCRRCEAFGGLAVVGDEQIEVAVVVDVARGQPASDFSTVKAAPSVWPISEKRRSPVFRNSSFRC